MAARQLCFLAINEMNNLAEFKSKIIVTEIHIKQELAIVPILVDNWTKRTH